MSNNEELACTYAALLLHDAGVAVSADVITKVAEAANVKVSSFWPTFFEQALKSNNLDSIILNVGAGSSAPAAAATGGAATPAAAAAAAAPEPEPESSSEEEMDGFALFG